MALPDPLALSKRVRSCIFLAALLYAAAAFFGFALRTIGLADPNSQPIEFLSSQFLFAAQDPFVSVALCVTLLLVYGAGNTKFSAPAGLMTKLAHNKLTVAVLMAATFILSLIFRIFFHESFGMSLDEFMPEFQAKIFRSGQLLAPLTEDMFEARYAFQPFFTYSDETYNLWSSHYRPVHAALIAAFDTLGAANLLNPTLAVVTLWATMDIAKRLFPSQIEIPLLAALLMIASPQFFATAGSGFSFSAHLAFNMAWLALFIRGRLGTHIIAAIIGFFAVGLHQVHVHPLFAAPFLAGLLFGLYGHRIALLPYVVGYAIALPLWITWPEIAVFLQTGDASVLPRSIVEIDYISNFLNHRATGPGTFPISSNFLLVINILRFVAWICPALLLLAIIATFAGRRIGKTPALAGISVLLTIGATYVLMPNQMQSWGARYYHPVLGCLILFALGGYATLECSPVKRHVASMTASLIIISGLIFVPWRGLQIEEKVAPRAQLQSRLTAFDADVLIIPSAQIWFGYDYVRNDPDLSNRPLIVSDKYFAQNPIEADLIARLDRDDMLDLGMPVGTRLEPGP